MESLIEFLSNKLGRKKTLAKNGYEFAHYPSDLVCKVFIKPEFDQSSHITAHVGIKILHIEMEQSTTIIGVNMTHRIAIPLPCKISGNPSILSFKDQILEVSMKKLKSE